MPARRIGDKRLTPSEIQKRYLARRRRARTALLDIPEAALTAAEACPATADALRPVVNDVVLDAARSDGHAAEIAIMQFLESSRT